MRHVSAEDGLDVDLRLETRGYWGRVPGRGISEGVVGRMIVLVYILSLKDRWFGENV